MLQVCETAGLLLGTWKDVLLLLRELGLPAKLSVLVYCRDPLAEWESPGSQSPSCQSHSDLCSVFVC